MPYRIESVVLEDTGTLMYQLTGKISSEDEFHQMMREITDIISASDCQRVLCDASGLEGIRPNINEAINVVENDFLETMRRLRIAVLERPENMRSTRYRETVAVNRGFTLKYFFDRAEAETWLNG